MAKYNAPSVILAKELIASRLSFVLIQKLKTTTRGVLATRIGMSRHMVNRLARGVSKNVSLDAMLLVAERLNVKYKVSMEWSGKGLPAVTVELVDLYPGLKKPVTKVPKHQSDNEFYIG
ncbi:putative transcriptional regulator [Pseudomonas phage OBP]|uniref:putative transcriptional regulator n=1 Tax=Pseudomonas phage OBP TaxID=1124849 RepID=UPI000240D586|nr:putative transcriptional regulator [Pseudomonas phage OBP]AEV89603.1 putative transcriptional regulator [Pseudomonas phage OBP]